VVLVLLALPLQGNTEGAQGASVGGGAFITQSSYLGWSAGGVLPAGGIGAFHSP